MDEKKAFDAYVEVPEDANLSKEEIQEKTTSRVCGLRRIICGFIPFNEVACDTIGFTFARDVADGGLEGYYNSTLTGVDGRQYGYINDDSDVEQTIIAPTNGRSIETTLDIGAQQIVEKWVNAFQEAMGGAKM